MIFEIKYYRHDKKITESKPVKADTIKLAIERLIDASKRHNAQISRLIVGIKDTGTHIPVCDTCQATDGVKNHICKACK